MKFGVGEKLRSSHSKNGCILSVQSLRYSKLWMVDELGVPDLGGLIRSLNRFGSSLCIWGIVHRSLRMLGFLSWLAIKPSAIKHELGSHVGPLVVVSVNPRYWAQFRRCPESARRGIRGATDSRCIDKSRLAPLCEETTSE